MRDRLGLTRQSRPQREERPRRPAAPARPEREDTRALSLWRQRQPIVGSVAERYLRRARGYSGPIPPTLGFLPARGDHPPSMIAAFAFAAEPEPRQLAIDDASLRGVHVTRLLPHGTGRISKATIGRGSTGVPIVLAPPNDLLGLAITEGIEDGVSIHAATGLGVWAAGSAGRMLALAEAVPNYVECVNIFAHDDPAGRLGAAELAARLKARGV